MPAQTELQPPAVKGTTRKRRIAFRLFAICLGITPFVVLELLLAAFDVGRTQEYDDPFIGFSQVYPLFELDESAGRYRMSKPRELNFGYQEFSSQKPKNGFRIFCLGGSTVRGRPFETETAFAKWMEMELKATDPDHEYEIVNCGGLSYASYRLVVILEEVLRYEPDLIVVATGHNEFLEDRTYQHIKNRSVARRWFEDKAHSLRTVSVARGLWHSDRSDQPDETKPILAEDVDPKLDSDSGYASYHRDDQWRQSVIAHFEHSVRALINLAERAKVPLVMVNLGANLRDCPPFKSEHKKGLEADAEMKWQVLFENATKADGKDARKALNLYRKAEQIDGEHALLAYRMARCLDRLKRGKEARKLYIKAKDLDICPLRIIEPISDILQNVSNETETPLVNARELFERSSRDGLSGNDWFVDHVHPSPRGHQLIAQHIVKRLAKLKLVESSKPIDNRGRLEIYGQHWRKLGLTYTAKAQRRVGWLQNWARRHKLFEETLPIDADGFFRQARKDFSFGQVEMGWAAFQVAMSEDIKIIDQIVEYSVQLFEQGRFRLSATLIRLMQEDAAFADHESELIFAEMVLALVNGDLDYAKGIKIQHQMLLDELSTDSIWFKTAPDALHDENRFRRTIRPTQDKD